MPRICWLVGLIFIALLYCLDQKVIFGKDMIYNLIDNLEEHNWEDSFLFDYEELDFGE